MVEWENWICPMLAMLTFSTMLSDFAACEGLKMIVMWWRFDACWKNGAAVVNVDWATLWHLQLEPLLWTSHCNIGLKKLVNNPFRNCVIAVDLISWRVLKFEFYIGFKLSFSLTAFSLTGERMAQLFAVTNTHFALDLSFFTSAVQCWRCVSHLLSPGAWRQSCL